MQPRQPRAAGGGTQSDQVRATAETLYRNPPQDFVGARDEAVRRLRAEDAPDAARAVARLRRPTVGAWLVNLLVAEEPGLPQQLTDLAQQLRIAQEELSGDDLRALGRQRQQLVAGLVARARELARSAGRPVSDDTLVEVETTLRAALADPAVATEVLSGRLLHAADFTGFGPATPPTRLRPPAGAAAPPGGARPAATQQAQRGKKEHERADRERAQRERADRERAQRDRAERALRDAEQDLRAAEADRAAADNDAAEAGAALSAAQDRLAGLHEQLAQAERELEAARRADREARARSRAAASAVTRARRRVDHAAQSAG